MSIQRFSLNSTEDEHIRTRVLCVKSGRAGDESIFFHLRTKPSPRGLFSGQGQIVRTPACVFRSISGVQTGARRAQSEHPRVWYTQQRGSLAGASRIAHCLYRLARLETSRLWHHRRIALPTAFVMEAAHARSARSIRACGKHDVLAVCQTYTSLRRHYLFPIHHRTQVAANYIFDASRTVFSPVHPIGHTQLPRENDVKVFNTTARRWRRLYFHLRRVHTVESRMGKHPDGRQRGSVCAPVTTPACAVPPEILEGGVNSVSSTHLSCDGMNLSRS